MNKRFLTFIFRRVRPDGTEAEEFKFIRDASGKVIDFVSFSNITHRTAPLTTP